MGSYLDPLKGKNMKTIFTVGQVAKICKVAPRTVSKWFDAGRLRGYRIPGSQDRRIPREHLICFLKEHGMPLNGLESRNITLLGLEEKSLLRLKNDLDACYSREKHKYRCWQNILPILHTKRNLS